MTHESNYFYTNFSISLFCCINPCRMFTFWNELYGRHKTKNCSGWIIQSYTARCWMLNCSLALWCLLQTDYMSHVKSFLIISYRLLCRKPLVNVGGCFHFVNTVFKVFRLQILAAKLHHQRVINAITTAMRFLPPDVNEGLSKYHLYSKFYGCHLCRNISRVHA